jgi:hypothetical protein
MNERGFKYDRLTEAGDDKVEPARHRLYAAPCGYDVWVSVKDGTVVRGNGGNEREQWHWQKIGPWVRIPMADVRSLFSSEFAHSAALEKRLEDIQRFVAEGGD